MKICAYCKSRVYPQDRKCPSCGSTVFIADAEEPRAAPKPENPYREGYRDAYQDAQASARQTPPPFAYTERTYAQARSPRSRWLALLLWVVGGYIGLHRFYAGKIGTGVLYLCTGGLFGIGAIVDGISLLLGTFRDGQGYLMA